MKDLEFDFSTSELVIVDGDFVLTDKVNAQNANMFYLCRAFSPLRPTLGIGSNSPLNSKAIDHANLLNKWIRQVIDDGAKTASWRTDDDNNPVISAEW